MSHGSWQSMFGADPDVTGRVLRLDDHPYTVAGVLPAGFVAHLPRFPGDVDVWKVPDDWWQNGEVWTAEGAEFALLDLVARLRPGVGLDDAEREMKAFQERMRREHLEYEQLGVEYSALPLHDTVVGDVAPQLMFLSGAVGLVLLVVCANVAGLLLARARARSHELSLRAALGAPRRAIVRMLAIESALYAAGGAVAAMVIAVVALDALIALRPEGVPRLTAATLDADVLAFTLLATLVSTFLFGMAPALVAGLGRSSTPVASSRLTASPSQGRLARALVVAEVAVALALLIGAALLTTSLGKLHRVQPGFAPDDLLTFSVSLPGTRYERPEGTDRFFRRFEDAIEALPGVESAALVWPLPLAGRSWANQYIAGAVDDAARRYAVYRLATPGLFETMRIPLLAGRSFGQSDPRHVAVVSERLAEVAWPGESPLGMRIQANPWGGGLEPFEVIGVVGDVQSRNLRETPQEAIYFDSRGWSWTDWEVDYVVRTAGAPEALVATLREALASLDPSVPLARVSSMDAYLARHKGSHRFALALLGLFALVAGGARHPGPLRHRLLQRLGALARVRDPHGARGGAPPDPLVGAGTGVPS